MMFAVIDFIAAIPVFVFDDCTFPPFFVLERTHGCRDGPRQGRPPMRLAERIASAKAVCSFFIGNSYVTRMLTKQVTLFVFRLDETELTVMFSSRYRFFTGLFSECRLRNL